MTEPTVIPEVEEGNGPALGIPTGSRSPDGSGEEAGLDAAGLYRLVFRLSPDPVVIATVADGILIDMNDLAESLTGYTREEGVGAQVGRLLDVAREDRIFLAEAVRHDGSVRDRCIAIRRKTGETVLVETSAQRMSHEGEPCLIAILKDVTDRRRQERELRESEARYRAVVETQSEFIVRWLPDGTRTFVNEAYCRYFGGLKEELEGTSFFPLISVDDWEALRSRIAALTPANPASTGRHRGHRTDGPEGWQEWTDLALFDDSGRVVELQSVGRDVTDLVAARQALEESRAHLNATLNAVPDLIFRHTVDGTTLAIHAQGAEHLIAPGVRIGTKLSDTLPLDVADQWLQAAQDVSRLDALVAYEYELTFDGAPYRFEARMVGSGPGEVLTIVRDITETVREQEAAQRADTLFQAAWDQSPASILVAEPDGEIRYVNRSFLAGLGLSPENLAGQALSEIYALTDLRRATGEPIHAEDFPIARATRGEAVHGEEFIASMAGGEPRRVVVNAAPVVDADGTLIAGVSVAQDVTDLRLEAAGRAAGERLFQSFFEQMAAGAVVVELAGRIRRINPTFERMLGAEIGALSDESIFDVMTPATRARAEALIRTLKNGAIDRFWGEETYLRVDGRPLSVYSSFSLVRDERGQPDYVIGLIQDLSERRRLEGEVLEVAEQERERLGRDLHDGLGQELTAAALLARALERALEPVDPAAAARAREIRDVAQAALSQTRFLAQGLLPPPLQGGVNDALADLASNAAELFGVHVSVDVIEETEVRDEQMAAHLYHICREAITNAVRHGKANEIRVALLSDERIVKLEIRDDGVGMPDTPISGGGLGLRNMRFRANQLGGTLDIGRAPGSGTVVVCTVDRHDEGEG